MTEPVNLWQPSTDEYKAQAAEAPPVEAQLQEKLRELHETTVRTPWKQEKAPLGIRLFTWYYFGWAGICALMLVALVSFPQSAISARISDRIGGAIVRNYLDTPASKSQREASSAGTAATQGDEVFDEQTDFGPDKLHGIATGYLSFKLALDLLIGVMWLMRFWWIRWATMFYAGAQVAGFVILLMAGAASGVAAKIPKSEMPVLMLALGLNGLIFLYLSFGFGVKEWFEPGS